LAIAPSLIINQSAYSQVETAKHWCESQGKDQQWVFACQSGWYDHDHCQAYDPSHVSSNAGYKAGWDHGSCKK